jgi:hypothetical protein
MIELKKKIQIKKWKKMKTKIEKKNTSIFAMSAQTPRHEERKER